MPDPTKQTVSASQMPALFGLSPYCTEWLLFQHFANGMPLEVDADERMDWGTKLEAVILHATAAKLRADVIPHPQVDYLRHPSLPIGCTPDGYVLDPQRGLGFVEAKNIDYLRWRDTWTDTEAAPHVEAQHQTQLAIPHPEFGAPKWGVIAALVGGNDLRLYPRDVLPDVQAQIAAKARSFLDTVREKKEPPIAGRAMEIEGLHWAIPRVDRHKILREEDFEPAEAVKLARLIEQFHDQKARESVSKMMAKDLQAQIEGMVRDAAEVIVHQRRLKISRSEIAGRTQIVKPYTMVRMTPSILEFAADLDTIISPDELTPFGLPKDILV